MKKIILITVLCISSFYSNHHALALANPASVKCTTDGGVLSTVKDAQGNESSNCTFSNGKICDEWAYFRGQCTQTVITSMDQLPASCTNAFDGCNSCSRMAGGQWACTMRYCFAPGAIACTKYDTTIPTEPAMCTKEYNPVCGQPKMPECKDGMACPMMMPMNKTYSNACEMKAAGATLVKEGVCETDVISTPDICSRSVQKLTRGKKGDYVYALQDKLITSGFTLAKDGIFGRGMIAVIKEIQSRYPDMKVDGIFGKKTRDVICNNQIGMITYSAIIKKTPNAELMTGGSSQYKDINITATGLSQSKSVDVVITYDDYAIIPNPVHTHGLEKISLVMSNGQNVISKILIGPVLSITIDGQNIPFKEKN